MLNVTKNFHLPLAYFLKLFDKFHILSRNSHHKYNQTFEPADVVKIDNKEANFKQLDLFMDKLSTPCTHKDTMWDTGMQQSYCLECFNYLDGDDTYYNNNFSKGKGYY